MEKGEIMTGNFFKVDRAIFNHSIWQVLVQKLQDNCKESLNLGHIDIITLKKGRDQYEKATFIQVEALSA
jgi:hypothetical protein